MGSTVNSTSLFPSANITDFVGFFEYANSVTDNMFMNVTLMIFWVVTFISLKHYSTEQAFSAASFICMILSTLLRITGLVSEYLVILFLIMTGLSIFVLSRR